MAKSTRAATPKTGAAPAAVGARSSIKSGTPEIDAELVRAIATLLSETNVGEIEVSKGDFKVRVARHAAPVAYAPAPANPVYAAAAPAIVQAPVAPLPPGAGAATAGANDPGTLKSPMVGTAYRKPTPDAKAFVEVGSTVKAGDKLLLIEAMKTFNDITAPQSGTITAIFVDDGQPVEFGQPLLVIA